MKFKNITQKELKQLFCMLLKKVAASAEHSDFVDNNDGTFTHTSGDGVITNYDTKHSTIVLDAPNNTVTITGDDGNSVTLSTSSSDDHLGVADQNIFENRNVFLNGYEFVFEGGGVYPEFAVIDFWGSTIEGKYTTIRGINELHLNTNDEFHLNSVTGNYIIANLQDTITNEVIGLSGNNMYKLNLDNLGLNNHLGIIDQTLTDNRIIDADGYSLELKRGNFKFSQEDNIYGGLVPGVGITYDNGSVTAFRGMVDGFFGTPPQFHDKFTFNNLVYSKVVNNSKVTETYSDGAISVKKEMSSNDYKITAEDVTNSHTYFLDPSGIAFLNTTGDGLNVNNTTTKLSHQLEIAIKTPDVFTSTAQVGQSLVLQDATSGKAEYQFTDVYSASETVIGEFLGKPLYRKVILNSNTLFNVLNLGGDFAANELDAIISLKISSPGANLNYFDVIVTSYNFTTNTGNFTSQISYNPANIIIEYTKP